ncbi:hypothetical protein ACQKP0_05485 [Heyndrickxia sp. NPDC080065]|uniref:hypothetical protein n=1 Tax=Heyndrickxia sp. NPDC080065 TaxID=3390568 RepID=UPI003D05206A
MLKLIIYLLLGIVMVFFVSNKNIWFRIILILIWPFYLLYKLVELTDGIKDRSRKDKDKK